jgi:hypothetical protein
MAAQTDAIHVIDNFLDAPHELRRLGLEAEYPPMTEQPYFPGRNSRERAAIPDLDTHISRIVGAPVRPTPNSAHGKFRLCLDGEIGKGGVHIDNCHWTGVLYLSLDDKGASGTDFFRHRPSNTLRAPVYPEDWDAWGFRDVSKLWTDVINPHTNDASKWELVRRVPMAFNRLLLFEPWQWHNAGPGFGDRAENGRLIYLLSYDPVR